jgi:small subunit ribosomal protein S5
MIMTEEKTKNPTQGLEKIEKGTQEDSSKSDKPTEPVKDTESKPTEEAEVVKEVLKTEEDRVKKTRTQVFDKEAWKPKTDLGRKVKAGEITDINLILDNGLKVLEPEIIDVLLPNIQTDLLMIGQSKGKFGGGQRRVFKQTQKKTKEGNKPKFATLAVVGNEDGIIGIGYGKAKETVPAREKALRNAKLNVFKIRRGSGSWESHSVEANSIPFAVQGKCGSVIANLKPAPRGTGLCAEKECAKIFKLAGIKDIWSKTKGQTKTKLNLIYAVEKALKRTISTKIQPEHVEKLVIVEGISAEQASDKEFLEEIKNKDTKKSEE